VTPSTPRRTLRRRLALFQAILFLCSGLVLLVLADLPLLTFSHVCRAAGDPGSAGQCVQPRSGSSLHEVLVYSAIALVIMVPVSIALGRLVADRALRPLRAITAAARAISDRNLNERLNLGESYREFAELGETLDDLFARLEASFESQRHFVANASHELRTPVAAERTLIQVALADPDATAAELRSTCQQLLALGEQQERLIEALLTLASSQRGLEYEDPVDLAELTREVLGARGREAGAQDITIRAGLSPAVTAGDPRLAGILVANLVGNALSHNIAGGWVEVATVTSGGAAHLTISNSGPVVPPGEVDRLFQPFQQLGPERIRRAGGLGLGLAIVRAIARTHGAVVVAGARPGGGLDIAVTFGRAPSGPAATHAAGPITLRH
jgi:signal transduction histidine kinase